MKTYVMDLIDISKVKSILKTIFADENSKLDGKRMFFGCASSSKGNVAIFYIGLYFSNDMTRVRDLEVALWDIHKNDEFSIEESQFVTRFPKLFRDVFRQHGYDIIDCSWEPSPGYSSGAIPDCDHIKLEIDCTKQINSFIIDPNALLTIPEPSLKQIQMALESHPESLRFIFENDHLYKIVMDNSKLMKEVFKIIKKHQLCFANKETAGS